MYNNKTNIKSILRKQDNRGPQAFHSREESLPEYEAWRAERNRIDEARINRQKTAEGNWRREWDSNKVSHFLVSSIFFCNLYFTLIFTFFLDKYRKRFFKKGGVES